MPGIAAVYQPNNRKVAELADKERQERLDLINTYWRYYDGKHKQPLKVQPGQTNDNIILNFSGQAIDKKVAFFAPQPPAFRVQQTTEREPGGDGLQTIEPPEQAAVDAFWETNQLSQFIIDMAMSGFISGHSFVRLYAPENTAAIGVDNPARAVLLDPRLVTVFWDEANIHKVLWYRLTWGVEGQEMRRQDIVPTWLLNQKDTEGASDDGTWRIIEYRSKSGYRWDVVGDDLWGYSFAPIVDWKNRPKPHSYYGESDLRDADVNDSINFIASNTARIIRFHAHPRTVLLGASADEIHSTSVDGLWEIPNEVARVENIEMQSDLGSSLNMLNLLRAAFFTQMRVVDLGSIQAQLGKITNFGVQMLYKDQTDDNETKRSMYGAGLSEVTRRALVMMGMAEAAAPTPVWAEPLPLNRLELVGALAQERALGAVSLQTVQEDLQRDPTVEEERKADESANSTDALVDTLTKLGTRGAF